MSRLSGDALRVLAMLAVLFVHSTGSVESLWSDRSGDFGVAFFTLAGQVARFCVPLFVILSGFGLAASQLAAEKRGDVSLGGYRGVFSFYRKRALRILAPWLFFAAAYFYFWRSFDLAKLKDFPVAFLTGGASYHLYFLPLIALLTLLFPFLVRLRHGAFVVLAGLLMLLSTRPGTLLWDVLGIDMPSWPSWFPFAWLFCFQFGIWWAARRSTATRPSLAATGAFFVVAGTLLWVILDFVARATPGHPTGWHNHFHRLPVMLYAVAVFLLFAHLSIPKFLEKAVTWLALLSFPVYLIHPALLVLAHALLDPLPGSAVLHAPLLLAFTTLSSIGAAWLLHRFVRGKGWRACLGLA